VKQKPDLPDLSGPLSKTVPLTAIAAANVKVAKYFNICGILSPHLILQTHAPFSATHDDKIHDCGL